MCKAGVAFALLPVLMAAPPSVSGQNAVPSGARTVAIQPVRVLTSNGGADPSVSPDGRRVVFSRRLDVSPQGKGQLWTVPFQGSDAPWQLLTPPDFPYNAVTPSWSPDGRWIAFRAVPATGGGGIWLMSASGADPRPLSDDAVGDSYPRWLPDGRRVLVTRTVTGNVGESDVWMIDIDSRTARQLTSDPAYDGAPTISPDGVHVAFPSDRSGQRDIWIISLAEGEVQARPFTTDGGRGPAWSPDGRWIAYGCPAAPMLYALCLKAVAGGHVIQVTDGKVNDFNPHWAPDGKSIIVSRTSGLAVIDVATIMK